MEKILVIEDNDLLRDNISEILAHEGYEVRSAENGKVGVERALAFAPDLIVSDINMPIMDGFEVLEALKEDDVANTIPFVFLTVKNTMQELRRGMNLGADDYLTKPFDMNQLLMAVRTRLNKNSQIIAKEEAKYDELKNAVGLPITAVIDDPLRNIERLAELVTGQMGELSKEDVNEITKLIANDASKLRKDINKLLFFYRIEALKNNPDSIDELRELSTDNIQDFLPLVVNPVLEELRRRSDFHIHLERATVKFPQDFLEYIISELLQNACKFSTKGSDLQLIGQKRVDGYVLTVKDKGVGFTEGVDIDKFTPYIKLNQRKSKDDGLGLGLYNVKTCLDLLGAKFTLKTAPGLGTAAHITLPLLN